MKWIGTDWFSLDAEEIKCYLGTARGVATSPGVRISGLPASGTCRVDIHRSHSPLLPGASLGFQPGNDHEIPEESRGWLRPFQLEAVDWLRQRHGAILALDLGGGKTATATAATELPVVVLVPVTVIDVWRTECRRLGWTHHLCQDVLELKTAIKAGKTDCYILPYSRADKLAGYFTTARMGTVIADEAHILTNKWVTWSQSFRGIPRERTILLTATPMRNRLVSLWGLLDSACPGAFGPRNAFRAHYCGAHPSPYGGMVDTGRTNQEELAARLTEVVYKRTRAQMALPLPEHSRTLVEMTLPEPFPTFEVILKGVPAPTGAHLTILGSMRQHLSLQKAKNVELQSFTGPHRRTVWWVWFKETAAILQRRLEALGLPVDVMTGESPTKKRTKILEEWGNPAHVGRPRALVASVAAASAGISLSNAEAAIFVDLDWTPLNLIQAEKRHHRFGSFLPELWTYYLTARGTIDDAMALSLTEKQEDSEASLGEDGTLGQMRALLGESENALSEEETIANLVRRMLEG
jgi:SNF2 family DNA or RNA helicase